MNLDEKIKAFDQLGKRIAEFTPEQLEDIAYKTGATNNWFTKGNVINALQNIGQWLNETELRQWTDSYGPFEDTDKKVGVVMAGNIPAVGFHDFLAVVISGHHLHMKLSHQDSFLPVFLANQIAEIAPELKSRIHIAENLKGMDAIIATGSDNSARYFEYYFSKIPHIIRKNRTSCAILTGEETESELKALGYDIFQYFGRGCRNVAKLLVPTGYDFTTLFEQLQSYEEDIFYHHKYRNNYDYNKSIYLVNKEPHLDNGFLLIRESPEMVSPIAVLFYETYQDEKQLLSILEKNQHKIQCVVGKTSMYSEAIPFGQTQNPSLSDYPDKVNLLQFLGNI